MCVADSSVTPCSSALQIVRCVMNYCVNIMDHTVTTLVMVSQTQLPLLQQLHVCVCVISDDITQPIAHLNCEYD